VEKFDIMAVPIDFTTKFYDWEALKPYLDSADAYKTNQTATTKPLALFNLLTAGATQINRNKTLDVWGDYPASRVVMGILVDQSWYTLLNNSKGLLLNIAKSGLVLHPKADLIAQLRMQGTPLKTALKVINAHNQKLGLNWNSMPGHRGYYPPGNYALWAGN